MIEIHLEANFEAVKRDQLRPLVAIFDANFLLDANETFWRVLFYNPRRLQQKYERPGAAVHYRYFGRRQIDVHVVDSESRQRRHQVFNGCDLDTVLNQSRARTFCFLRDVEALRVIHAATECQIALA